MYILTHLSIFKLSVFKFNSLHFYYICILLQPGAKIKPSIHIASVLAE